MRKCKVYVQNIRRKIFIASLLQQITSEANQTKKHNKQQRLSEKITFLLNKINVRDEG